MNSELQKILSKYAELDRLAESGEDVVADLRKEINNLELAYLKDIVLPKVAKTFGGLVDGLRCDIDGNLTRYQDKNVEYAFGTSVNRVMLKGEVNASESNENTSAATPIAVIQPESPHLSEAKSWDRHPISNILNIDNDLLEPDLFTQAGVNIPLTHDEWIEKILNMRVMQYKGFYAPHKAIFMLAIIEAINEGIIIENKIDASSNLEENFNKLWNEYVPSDWPFRSNIYQAYIHMSGEPFYYLEKLDGVGNFDINQGWYRGLVLQYVEYTYFDECLFNLLHDQEFTGRLSILLIDKFIDRQKNRTDIVKNILVADDSSNSSYYGYRAYLATLTSNTGSNYSQSSIGVYSSVLRSKYMRVKTSKYSSIDDIYSIYDLSIIDKILYEVKLESEQRIISRSMYPALRMYRDYRRLYPSIDTDSASENISLEKQSLMYGVFSDVDETVDSSVYDLPHFKGEPRNQKNRRNLFSLNGGYPLNKRQTVLEVLRLYINTHPEATYHDIEMAFPKTLQGGYGVVATLTSINNKWHEGQDIANRYYLDRDKILKSSDNVDFAVCNQWGYNFKNFQDYVKMTFGWSIESI